MIAMLTAALVASSLMIASASSRVLQYLYLLGRMLAAGWALVGLLWIARRLGLLRWPTLAVCAVGIGALTLPTDASSLAYRLSPSMPTAVLAALVVAVSLCVVMAAAMGRELSRRRLHKTALVVGALPLYANPYLLSADYRGAHLFVSASGVALIAAALVDAPISEDVDRRLGRRAWLLSALIALWSIAWPPSAELVPHQLRRGDDVMAFYVTRLHHLLRSPTSAEPPGRWRTWFVSREASPPRAPSDIARPDVPVVVVITVDSLRADLLNEEHAPIMTALAARGAHFTRAYVPGASTAYTLAQVFAGTYFSQQYWSTFRSAQRWPHADDSVRFPELLAASGVATGTVVAAQFLNNEIGVVRGFQEVELSPQAQGIDYAYADDVLRRLSARIARHRALPAFHFVHTMDPHRRTRDRFEDSDERDRYLTAIRHVDEHIGGVLEVLDMMRMTERTTLIVSSDHGEAWGEHGSKYHARTLYNELLHVPLIIVGPHVKAQRIETPVTLMDLGPTVLDLFGIATPGHYMGESLLPLIAGGAAPSRPIVAESRLKKALLFEDDIKVIVDDRNFTEEIFDLSKDPGELNNLIESDGMRQRVDVLRAFFDAHTIQRPGYKPPYRR